MSDINEIPKQEQDDDIDPHQFDKFKEADKVVFDEMRTIFRRLRNKGKLPPATEIK